MITMLIINAYNANFLVWNAYQLMNVYPVLKIMLGSMMINHVYKIVLKANTNN